MTSFPMTTLFWWSRWSSRSSSSPPSRYAPVRARSTRRSLHVAPHLVWFPEELGRPISSRRLVVSLFSLGAFPCSGRAFVSRLMKEPKCREDEILSCFRTVSFQTRGWCGATVSRCCATCSRSQGSGRACLERRWPSLSSAVCGTCVAPRPYAYPLVIVPMRVSSARSSIGALQRVHRPNGRPVFAR